MDQASSKSPHAVLFVQPAGVIWANKQPMVRLGYAADCFRVRMILVRVSGDKYIEVQIFRFDKDRQLSIHAEWRRWIADGAAIAQIEIDPDQLANGILQDESVLAHEPDSEAAFRYTVVADGLHIIPAGHQLRDHELYRLGTVERIVACKTIRITGAEQI
ncbi:hypothetical protein ACPOL_4030 [Acidisarcina polymorpha]|uniref:Uncharacterized protein n=1 Tax=Acidisarcina polymorpha TaxID=2211140 RepID=A0A2Z5G2N7_9BACT|nr:hypothetical protein ACPOL_4030 [Acidisarcina polymorpha]